MDRIRGVLFYFICAMLVFLPSLVSAKVKVVLNNGGEIIADSCEEDGGRLVCIKMGGTFDIGKEDVESMKEMGGGHHDASSGAPPDDQPAEQENKTEDTQGADRTGKENPPVSGQPGADKRLADLMQKKKDLAAEREKLLRERQQFQDDLKKAPDWMPTKQYDELNKKNTEIAEKVKRFNEEAERLNAEENRIVESRKKKD